MKGYYNPVIVTGTISAPDPGNNMDMGHPPLTASHVEPYHKPCPSHFKSE
ncbi:hypothetical protein [Paraferrimonas sp. SM1919]|nr:hypothetical protein [Paraferrimonas sp. SM1919]